MRRALLTFGAAATLPAGGLLTSGANAPSRAATQEPCDIYAAAGTPCAAAHSTTRALYAAYNGPLYQVRRSSTNTTTSISPLSAVGAGGPDGLANATAASTTVEGHPVYSAYIAADDGYRDDSTRNIATGNNSEGEYAIFDGTHCNGGCCFDYGNAETNNDGAGAMEAIYFGNIKVWGYGTGNGPWIMADMENGLFSESNAGFNGNDPTTNYRFTTAMIEGGQNQWAILGGNAQSGGLATDFSGVRPPATTP